MLSSKLNVSAALPYFGVAFALGYIAEHNPVSDSSLAAGVRVTSGAYRPAVQYFFGGAESYGLPGDPWGFVYSQADHSATYFASLSTMVKVVCVAGAFWLAWQGASKALQDKKV